MSLTFPYTRTDFFSQSSSEKIWEQNIVVVLNVVLSGKLEKSSTIFGFPLHVISYQPPDYCLQSQCFLAYRPLINDTVAFALVVIKVTFSHTFLSI